MQDLPARPRFIGFQEISCPAEARWAAKRGYFTVWADHGRLGNGRRATGCALAIRQGMDK